MRPPRYSFIILFVFFVLPWYQSSYSQRVGLVLSGGGAKGIAHISVINALKENGIPIDYIGGTSMGAIVGGLYASGYSPDEMIEIRNSSDFKFWFSGEIPSMYYYYYKERYHRWPCCICNFSVMILLQCTGHL